jgi:hypothetical protein
MVAGKRVELIVRDDASSGETGRRLPREFHGGLRL